MKDAPLWKRLKEKINFAIFMPVVQVTKIVHRVVKNVMHDVA
jgi:hypothetical protein